MCDKLGRTECDAWSLGASVFPLPLNQLQVVCRNQSLLLQERTRNTGERRPVTGTHQVESGHKDPDFLACQNTDEVQIGQSLLPLAECCWTKFNRSPNQIAIVVFPALLLTIGRLVEWRTLLSIFPVLVSQRSRN